MFYVNQFLLSVCNFQNLSGIAVALAALVDLKLHGFEAYLTALQNKTVAVIGIGVSNRPLIDLLCSRGIAVTACDKKSREALGSIAEELEAKGVTLRLGQAYLENLTEDVIFRTPGMRPDLPQLMG